MTLIDIFLNLAALLGIIIIGSIVLMVLIFVIDNVGGIYEEYKKIKEQENE